MIINNKIKNLQIFILLFSFIFVSSCIPKIIPREICFTAMNTFVKIQVFDKEFPNKEVVFLACEKKVKNIEAWGNHFSKTSKISFVNAVAKEKWVPVNPDFYYVLEVGKKAGYETKGDFDITVKPLIDFYKIKQQESTVFSEMPKIPSNIKSKIGFKNISLDPLRNRVLLNNDVQIDLSGILKGFAVDQIVSVLRANSIKKAIVNAGGTVYCMGSDVDGKPWVIGIRDPKNKNKIIKRISLENKAVSTSAGYERFIIINGKEYSHIVNPKTCKLVPAKGSVTVVSDMAVSADILSTAAFVDSSIKRIFTTSKFYFIN